MRKPRLMLQTIGKFIGAQLKPLQKEIARLESAGRRTQKAGVSYKGTYQKACDYAVGDLVSYDHCVWCCIQPAQAGESPGAFPSQWQMALRGDGRDVPRQPTAGGARPETTISEAHPMTLDEALQLAAQKLDQAFVETVESNYATMVEYGLSDSEIADFQKMEADKFPALRNDALATLRESFQTVCLQRGAEEFQQRWDVA